MKPEEKELAHVVDVFGDDWLVFASDYSHFDSRFPGASEPIVNHPELQRRNKAKNFKRQRAPALSVGLGPGHGGAKI